MLHKSERNDELIVDTKLLISVSNFSVFSFLKIIETFLVIKQTRMYNFNHEICFPLFFNLVLLYQNGFISRLDHCYGDCHDHCHSVISRSLH